MGNISHVLNDHIKRVARREYKQDLGFVKRTTAQFRREMAELKRQLASLQKSVGFLEKQESRRTVQPPPATKSNKDIRFRADGLRSHRRRLALSARDYGLLVGVTGQTIYDWEMGKSKPRKEQVAKVVALRGVGQREAQKRLEILGGSGGKPRQRGRFEQTAQQFILEQIKNKITTTADVNAEWTKAGRGGKADNTLTHMVKTGILIRTKLDGGRGSTHALASPT